MEPGPSSSKEEIAVHVGHNQFHNPQSTSIHNRRAVVTEGRDRTNPQIRISSNEEVTDNASVRRGCAGGGSSSSKSDDAASGDLQSDEVDEVPASYLFSSCTYGVAPARPRRSLGGDEEEVKSMSDGSTFEARQDHSESQCSDSRPGRWHHAATVRDPRHPKQKSGEFEIRATTDHD